MAAILWALLYAQFTVDDAFIFFRYGRTLHLHHTWNWNWSGPHTEAYTSGLYVFFSILPPLLHIPPALLFKAIGLSCLLLMALVVWKLTLSPLPRLLAFSLLLMQPYVWVHAFSCLETPVFMLLILAMGVVVVLPGQSFLGDARFAYTLALLLPLTRPEGVIFSLVGIWLYWRQHPSKPRHYYYLSALVACAIGYFAASWLYFHSPLPNPFYVKVSRPSIHVFLQNLRQTKLLVPALLLSFFINRNYAYRVMCLTGLGVIGALYLPHDMAMNYGERYVFQIAFPIILLSLITLKVTIDAHVGVAAVAVLALLSASPRELKRMLRFWPDLETAHVDLGKSIAPFAANHILLAGDMGSGPYFSDWISYDFIGLCTNEVARHGLTKSFLQSIHPDLILLYARSVQTADGEKDNGQSTLSKQLIPSSFKEQDEIRDYMLQSGNYVYVGSTRWYDLYLMEYVRTDTPDFQLLRQRIQESNARNDSFRLNYPYLIKQGYLFDQFK